LKTPEWEEAISTLNTALLASLKKLFPTASERVSEVSIYPAFNGSHKGESVDISVAYERTCI